MWQMELDFSQPVQTPDEAIQASIAEAVKKATQPRPQLNRDGSRKLEDFGEDLGNTRKGKKYGEGIANLVGLRERLAHEPLEKVWPKESILKMGNTQAAALLWFARQMMPNRRPMKKFQLERYLNQAEGFIQFQLGIEAGTMTTDKLIDVSPKIIDMVYELKEVSKFLAVTDRKFWSRVSPGYFRDFNNLCRWNDWDMPQGVDPSDGKMRILMPAFDTPRDKTFHGYKLIEGSSWEEIGQGINAHLDEKLSHKNSAENKPLSKPVQFATQKLDSDHYRIYGSRGTIEAPLMEMEAKTREEVVQYIRSHTEELSAKYELIRTELSRDEFSYKPKLIRDRVGTDWRNGKDVTPEQFEEVFGFRGVEFGNWVNQGKNSRERQWMLNNAFDAFNDLAETLNLPPKAMALDGTLGLAFGSRGHGKASAHYEPVAHVINLTKTKGYSSLAHEWFHALDHYIASTNSQDMHAFQSNYGKARYKLKPEAIERLKTTVDEEYLDSVCQSVENRLNLFYDSIFRGKDSITQHTCGNSNRNSATKAFKIEITKEDLTPVYPDLLRTTIRPELYHAWRETIETIRSTRMSERTRDRAIKKGKAESSVEDDYWYSKIEQAARSFEGFIEAKLTKEGKISDFLTFGSYSEQPNKNDGTKFFPYLDGDDVQRVSEKFAKVFDVLQTRQTQKGVMLFSKLIDKVEGLSVTQVRSCLADKVGQSTIEGLEKNGLLSLAEDENMAYVEAMIRRAVKEGKAQVFEHPVELSKINKKTKFVVNDDLATLENEDGWLATVSCEGKRGFPDGYIVLKQGFHRPLKHNGIGARHLTGNAIEDARRDFYPEIKNKTESSILSCLDVLKSCSKLYKVNEEKFVFYSAKLNRAVVTLYDKDYRSFSIITDTPVGVEPEKLFGNLWIKNNCFVNLVEQTKNPKQMSGVKSEVASGVLASPELGASTALPPSKLQRADSEVETRPNLDIGTTSGDDSIKKEIASGVLYAPELGASATLPPRKLQQADTLAETCPNWDMGTISEEDSINDLYEDVDYTETVLRQIELAKAKALSQSTLDSAQGFYDPILKRSFLIAENLTEETAYPVLLHEVGVHMAHDSILHDKFAPVIDQAVQIVNDGLAQNDPLAQAVKNRLDLAGISSEDENYKEEVCAHLVEEAAKQELQKPQVVQWFNKVKSTVNTWLVEHGWKEADSLSATDIATIAKNNVRELSKLKLEQAFTLVPEGTLKADLMLSKAETFPTKYQAQKTLLDKPVKGKFIVEGYAETDTFKSVNLGENVSLREAIEEAKYLFDNSQLDNIAFVDPNTGCEVQIDEVLAREIGSQIVLEPKLPANKSVLAEIKELAESMGNELTERILNPVMTSIMEADRKGLEYRPKDNFNGLSQVQRQQRSIKRNG